MLRISSDAALSAGSRRSTESLFASPGVCLSGRSYWGFRVPKQKTNHPVELLPPTSATTTGAVDRAVRDLPWESRFELLKQRKKPRYMSECRGTPRREYQENMIDGIRIHSTFNPYLELNKNQHYHLDIWPSRNWDKWDPRKCHVRGSLRRYDIPRDFMPYKDELGEWHPPKLSGRYQADVKKQYQINGLPWMWDKRFYEGTLNYHDRQPLGPKKWYIREFKKERIKEAMRKMDETVFEHRKEARDRREHRWLEKVVVDIAGEELASNYIRKRRIPQM
ncbi:unnamed protein product [Vitrella brassicaformis CCMP3155]|uniref:MRPL25 domain-containing protein n=2 Tax=Vitrella brassicaformis TaxID=1169539 RepID=A0A0G4GAQ6_VITBC|nr:unnamed protein product [Vitrella brassicaformis CCMP3155]|eukprot:CEM25815.1 unnamed protein product [Vitrella brassicaformis CCMP3155]